MPKSIPGLTIIGETINDSVPSTKKLFDEDDLDGLVELARFQDRRGAGYIDVNVGTRPAQLMAELVRRIQQATAKPLAIDTPDFDVAKAGLEAYDASRAGGQEPILNSVTETRLGMLDLYEVQPFRPILLVSEQEIDGDSLPCRTAEETFQATRRLVATFHGGREVANHDCIIDPGIAPLGSDVEGNIHRLFRALGMIRAAPELAGVHVSVGLSNFTVMLPPKRADGSPLKSALESAFLTKAMPLGLDVIIGSVRRNYRLLSPDHPAMICLEDCLKMSGFDMLRRLRAFYT